MSNLLSEGNNVCVYYRGITCSGNVSRSTKKETKIRMKNFNANNEFNIGMLIRQIPNYDKYFLPSSKKCDVDVRKMNDHIIEKCHIINTNNHYTLLHFPYYPKTNMISFFDGVETDEELLHTLFETYRNLLIIVQKLVHHNILHFDLHANNVFFKEATKTPIIINYEKSIFMGGLTLSNIGNHFPAYCPDNYFHPIEVHALSFLLNETITVLTETNIKRISKHCMDANKTLVTKQERKISLQQSIEQLYVYVNMPRVKVMEKIIALNRTWDNFAISVIFLTIFESSNLEQNLFNQQFTQILKKNTSPDPRNRLEINETYNAFNNIFLTIRDVNVYKNLVHNINIEGIRK